MRCTIPKNSVNHHHYSICFHFTAVTYPDISILVVWFPVSPCVAIEHTILSDPVRTAVSALSGNSSDLLPAPKIHLQPLVMIAVWWRPASCTCWVDTEGRDSDLQHSLWSEHIAKMLNAERQPSWEEKKLEHIEEKYDCTFFFINTSSAQAPNALTLLP